MNELNKIHLLLHNKNILTLLCIISNRIINTTTVVVIVNARLVRQIQ